MENLDKRAKEALSLIKKPVIYFAHPINVYNAVREEKFLETIGERFPNFNLYNPNNKKDQENYRLWKKERGSGMKYFFDIILPEMDEGIYLAFEDGKIGCGVFGEMMKFVNLNKPVWEIDWDYKIKRVEGMEGLRELSHEETVKRVYGKR